MQESRGNYRATTEHQSTTQSYCSSYTDDGSSAALSRRTSTHFCGVFIVKAHSRRCHTGPFLARRAQQIADVDLHMSKPFLQLAEMKQRCQTEHTRLWEFSRRGWSVYGPTYGSHIYSARTACSPTAARRTQRTAKRAHNEWRICSSRLHRERPLSTQYCSGTRSHQRHGSFYLKLQFPGQNLMRLVLRNNSMVDY